MSLRLAIPRPVGLHQSPPPLCQPRISLTEIRYFEKEKSWNGRCANNGLSQLRGSPHGCVPALSLVPSVAENPVPSTLQVDVDGNSQGLLSFKVEDARALLAKAGLDAKISPGHRVLELSYHAPTLPDTKLKGEILQQQWRRNLGIRVNLAA